MLRKQFNQRYARYWRLHNLDRSRELGRRWYHRHSEDINKKLRVERLEMRPWYIKHALGMTGEIPDGIIILKGKQLQLCRAIKAASKSP